MGGPRSGRWLWHSKRRTVEACLELDAATLQREGVLQFGVQRRGSCKWTYPECDEEVASITFEVNSIDPDARILRLSYGWDGRLATNGERVDYVVRLATTRPHFGGLRWWFVCPLSVSNQACGRRVRKLYLDGRCKYFGCRHCLGLTYRSAQEHDKRVDILRKQPEKLMGLMRGGAAGLSGSQLSLALRALRRR